MKVRLFGKFGDLVYQLAAVRELVNIRGGKAAVELVPKAFPYAGTIYEMTVQDLQWMKPLIEEQDSYIHSVRVLENDPPFGIEYDLWRWFRHRDSDENHVLGAAIDLLKAVRDPPVEPNSISPWLKNPEKDKDGIVAVSRTGRYPSSQTKGFWQDAIAKYKPTHFVGTPAESDNFKKEFGCELETLSAETSMGLVTIIDSTEVLIADQSFPLAIAHGLGKAVVAEVSETYRDCVFVRGNARYPNLSDEKLIEVGLKMHQNS